MKISGFIKTSLLDYEGKIVSVIFTQGCNFKCPYCHNPQLIPLSNEETGLFSVKKIINFLQQRKGLIDGISITGGEPTLQQDLVSFIERVKSLGLLVKLDTNGSRPEILEKLLPSALLDYVALDIKMSPDKYHLLSGTKKSVMKIQKSLQLIKKSKVDYELRTTVVPGLHSKDDIKSIGNFINKSSILYLQNFRPLVTYDTNLSTINSFPPSKLEEFKEILKTYVDLVKIRD